MNRVKAWFVSKIRYGWIWLTDRSIASEKKATVIAAGFIFYLIFFHLVGAFTIGTSLIPLGFLILIIVSGVFMIRKTMREQKYQDLRREKPVTRKTRLEAVTPFDWTKGVTGRMIPLDEIPAEVKLNWRKKLVRWIKNIRQSPEENKENSLWTIKIWAFLVKVLDLRNPAWIFLVILAFILGSRSR
jgi:hypothetical protein